MAKRLNSKTAPGKVHPVKVLQFGEGNFLRAFCGWMVDLLNEKADFNGSIQVVQPIRQGMGDMINAQDGLYHVVLNGIQGGRKIRETRLIRSLTSVINPYSDYQRFLQVGENPDLKLVFSNTTEAGIAFSSADISPEQLPESFPGKVAVLLYHRYKHFNGAADKGLVLMPCELIEKNGTNLKLIVQQYAALWKWPSGFGEWIDQHVLFCNTLVDRIVPGFPKETIQEIHNETGYEDNLVVMAEPFHLWVIEAPDHVKKIFPVNKAGLQVKFVSDLTPYRTRKVRILNGAHTAMTPVAYLRGIRTVRDAMEDPWVGEFIRDAVREEIIPTLDLSKEELEKFAFEVMERFQNPFIRHELSSIALNSISKYKVRVLPSVLQYIALKNKLPERLLVALAALIRFYKGEQNGAAIPVNDTPEIMAFFKDVWSNPEPALVAKRVLGNRDFWDKDLTQIPHLSDFVAAQLKTLI
jgi:tagaturonate reductase